MMKPSYAPMLAFGLCIIAAPSAAASTINEERLHEHELRFGKINNPDVLEGEPLYRRAWYLLVAAGDPGVAAANQIEFEKKLDRIWKKRQPDICAPVATGFYVSLVRQHFANRCPAEIIQLSSSSSVRSFNLWWIIPDGAKAIPADDLAKFALEAERGAGRLLVDSGADITLIDQTGWWTVDSDFVAMVGAQGSISVEDVIESGRVLADPSNAKTLELLGLADRAQTEGILQITETLAGIEVFDPNLGPQPQAPIDVMSAHRTLERSGGGNALIEFSKTAEDLPELGFRLLPLALQNHPLERESTHIQFTLQDGSIIEISKLKPDLINDQGIRTKRNSRTPIGEVREFQIIENAGR